MLKTLTFTILTFGLCLIGICFWAWHELETPINIGHDNRIFAVYNGDTVERVLNRLHTQHVLKLPILVRAYLKLSRQNPSIMAGTYTFPYAVSPIEVLNILKQGGSFNRITIIEGWNRFDIANALSHTDGLVLPKDKAVIGLLDNSVLIRDLDPLATNLEGYLFPDTYFLVGNSTAEQLVSDMVSRFRQVWQRHIKADAERNGITVHDAVVVASLIETEAKLPEERPIVASVIYNRIKASMPLSIDSSVVYASKLAGKWRNDGKVYQSDVDRESPYNTRRHVGLPPGPVGSPGLASLEAAVNPAHTDYLYYVRNPDRCDGAHNFYKDEKGFEQGVAALRAWEKKNH